MLIGRAGGAVFSYTNDVNQIIPDGNPTGLSSSITLSGFTAAEILDVNVYVNISGGFNGDLYGYLSFGGDTVILLNRVGKTGSDPFGYGDAGFLISLDDQALTDIHLYGGNSGAQLTGSWQPDGRDVDPQTVLATDPRTTSLSIFNGQSPNGTWTLFFADMTGGEVSTLQSWGLQITAVPEPTTIALGAFAGLAGFGALFRCWRRRRSSSQD